MIKNLVNEKFYVGKHSTNDLDDGYMGSGTLLQKAICKYGIENFRKQILEFFDSEEAAYDYEESLVTEAFIQDENTYNLVKGGKGFDNQRLTKLWNDPEFRARKSLEITMRNKKFLATEEGKKWRADLNKKIWTGRKHKEETKRKIGQTNSIKQKGEKNSQFGTMWITHPELKENKKIKKEEFQVWSDQGWIKGRK